MECQTFVDKFICFCMGIVILMEICSYRTPSFVQNVRKQGRGRCMFPNPLLGFNPQWHLFYICLVSCKVCTQLRMRFCS